MYRKRRKKKVTSKKKVSEAVKKAKGYTSDSKLEAVSIFPLRKVYGWNYVHVP